MSVRPRPAAAGHGAQSRAAAGGVPFLAGKGLSWRLWVSCRLQLCGRQEPEQPGQEHEGLCQVTAPGLWVPGCPEQRGAGAGASLLAAGAVPAWQEQPGAAAWDGPDASPGVGGMGRPRRFAVGAAGLRWQRRAGPPVWPWHRWGYTTGRAVGLGRDPRARSPAPLPRRPADTARPWERRVRLRGRGAPPAGLRWGPALLLPRTRWLAPPGTAAGEGRAGAERVLASRGGRSGRRVLEGTGERRGARGAAGGCGLGPEPLGRGGRGRSRSRSSRL